MDNRLQATLDAIALLDEARNRVGGVTPVTGVLWRAADLLRNSAKVMLTGPEPAPLLAFVDAACDACGARHGDRPDSSVWGHECYRIANLDATEYAEFVAEQGR